MKLLQCIIFGLIISMTSTANAENKPAKKINQPQTKIDIGTKVKVNSNNTAQIESIKAALQSAYPKLKVGSVSKTPFDGLYEVFTDGKIVYTDENVSWIIDGELIDIKNRKKLTSARMDELTRVDFNSLPLDQAIKVVRGNGSRKIAVFSDADCPYCQKLEKEGLLSLTDVTIYTFLFPLESLHPDALRKSKAIWCADDRVQAWNDWIINEQLPENEANCITPLEKNAALGKKIGVTSTPTLIFASGYRMLGAQSSKEIENALSVVTSKQRPLDKAGKTKPIDTINADLLEFDEQNIIRESNGLPKGYIQVSSNEYSDVYLGGIVKTGSNVRTATLLTNYKKTENFGHGDQRSLLNNIEYSCLEHNFRFLTADLYPETFARGKVLKPRKIFDENDGYRGDVGDRGYALLCK